MQVLADQPAQAGNDVKLTMDTTVQAETENALAQGIAEVRQTQDTAVTSKLQNFAATGGSAVVLDARTGSVVAMASFPSYPINQFTNGIPSALFQPCTTPGTNCSLLNRATQGLYPPGSTFKLMSAIAALEDNQVTPGNANYTFLDTGCVKFGAPGNYQQFCNAGKTPHGIVDLPKAIEVSSDVYFYSLGFRFFNTWNCGAPGCTAGVGRPNHTLGYGIQTVAREFGFGRPTGVGLPQEAAGRIPDLAFKQAINKKNPDPYSRSWLPGDSANVAVGQGDVLVTPLQLANAYATFINGGNLYSPRLAERGPPARRLDHRAEPPAPVDPPRRHP